MDGQKERWTDRGMYAYIIHWNRGEKTHERVSEQVVSGTYEQGSTG